MTEPFPQDILLAGKAIEHFVTTSAQPFDQLSRVTASGNYDLPFTNDRGMVIEQAGELYKKLKLKGGRQTKCPPLSNYQAQMIATRIGGLIKRSQVKQISRSAVIHQVVNGSFNAQRN